MSRILFEAKTQLHRVAHEQTIFSYHLVVCVPPVFRSENYRGGVLVHAYYYHKWCPAEFGVSLPGKKFYKLAVITMDKIFIKCQQVNEKIIYTLSFL